MNADGSKASQVSREKRWFVNSPTWAPDGQSIYARHHFVKTRSLGAGEIWLFHRQRRRRPAGHREERAGRRTPASRRSRPTAGTSTTARTSRPGETFEYNKDPYGDHLRDRPARSRRPGASAPSWPRAGGSITPRAVARRQVARLHPPRRSRQPALRDGRRDRRRDRRSSTASTRTCRKPGSCTASTRSTPGCPTARAIVIWGQGKIWRVDVAAPGARHAKIPFTRPGRADRQRRAPLPGRGRIPIASRSACSAHVKVVSPDGRSVVYSALGHLYVRALPTASRAGSRGDTAHEAWPSFSPDGRSDRLRHAGATRLAGALKVIGADGQGARDVVATPGHYVDAVVLARRRVRSSTAPCGRRRADRDVTYATEPGIFVVPTAGGSPRLVTRGGPGAAVRPHRHAHLLPRSPRRARPCSRSVTLDGADEIVHVQSENAIQIVPVARRQVGGVHRALSRPT